MTTATATSTPTAAASPQQPYRVIGTRPVRHDGVDKVTGAARYGADISLPGMLHAKILRSPHAHARIRSIDASKAEALPGVVAVLTAADFPIIEDRILDFAEVQGNARMIAENLMAKDKALYMGHAVAAVCAVSPHIATEALQLVEVDYEILPTVLTWRDAMAPDATLLHDDMTTYFRVERFARGDDTGVKSNIAGHIRHQVGDVEQGFRDSDLVIEREFETQTVHQGYIEPHVSTAMWSADGRVTVWTSTQGLFNIRAQTAAIIGVPESQVKVVPMEIGGRLRRQGHHLPGPGGRRPLPENRPPRQSHYGPHRGFRRQRPHFRHLYALQNGRQKRRLYDGRASSIWCTKPALSPAPPWAAAP